jgi:hypothetical protein
LTAKKERMNENGIGDNLDKIHTARLKQNPETGADETERGRERDKKDGDRDSVR